MSVKRNKAELITAIGHAVQAFQEATDRFDQAAADRLSLNRTDLRCLGILHRSSPTSVGKIGEAVNLTRGATTTAVDRLEQAGFVRRARHPSDRRGVLVEITDLGKVRVGEIWGSVTGKGEEVLRGFSASELDVILNFLKRAATLQDEDKALGERRRPSRGAKPFSTT